MNRMTGEEFLQSKDIWNHPNLTDRNNKECYDVAELLEEYAELKPTKRKPLPDGTLELTKEELEELGQKRYVELNVLGYGARSLTLKKIVAEKDCICIIYSEKTGIENKFTVFNRKAIAYLLERFEL